MRTIELITFNCFICLILVIVSTDSQLFSVLALATLAKVLRPRPKYRPPPMYPYDPMVSSSSHGAPIMMRPSPPPSPLTPQQFPMVQQSFSQPIPPISSKSGFGYPSNQLVSTNQAINWNQNQQSSSPVVPNFSYPANGFTSTANLQPQQSTTNYMIASKPQVYPLFKFIAVNQSDKMNKSKSKRTQNKKRLTH